MVCSTLLSVSVFLCAKTEQISDNSDKATLYWLEFVDRDDQPNYQAQRGFNMKKIPPGPMSKKEMAALAQKVAQGVLLEVVKSYARG